jgi:ribosomal protein S18 acetylase RimI-like enzyme
MATSASIEILDLRHFSAPMFRSVLDVESELWKQRLHWDYRNSARLLMQYLDNRMLPGFAALAEGRITGYVFCVYEETKAVIGDIFALPDSPAASAPATEETLLKHLFELLLNSPQIERIESQLLLHPSGFHRDLFREAGFQLYRRLFMMRTIGGIWSLPKVDLPGELELRPWRDEDLMPAARLIAESYRDHPDSLVNDQYRSAHGAMRFLNNIVHYAGCGPFSAPASHVVVHRSSQEIVALLLGSRVSPQSGHITQLCVHPDCRRHGLARLLLSIAAFHFMRQGASEISLTVTEANTQAIELYRAEGYTSAHAFDAAVWQHNSKI